MKKALVLIFVTGLMIVNAAAIEIGDLERLTLEGTYTFNITLDNLGKVQDKLKRYGSSEASEELANYSFKGEIKQEDGKYQFLWMVKRYRVLNFLQRGPIYSCFY